MLLSEYHSTVAGGGGGRGGGVLNPATVSHLSPLSWAPGMAAKIAHAKAPVLLPWGNMAEGGRFRGCGRGAGCRGEMGRREGKGAGERGEER